MFFDEDNVRYNIAKSLFDKGIIDGDLFEKCSKPKYIQSLPADLRTNDEDKLNERLDALQKLEDDTNKEYEEKYSEYEDAKKELKTKSDKIRNNVLNILETIENLNSRVYDYNYFDEEPYTYEGEENPDYDPELIEAQHDFYNAVNDQFVFENWARNVEDRLNGNEGINIDDYLIESELTQLVSSWETVREYYDEDLSDEVEGAYGIYYDEIIMDASKLDDLNKRVNDIENDLLKIRDKQNTIRGEYDRTFIKITE